MSSRSRYNKRNKDKANIPKSRRMPDTLIGLCEIDKAIFNRIVYIFKIKHAKIRAYTKDNDVTYRSRPYLGSLCVRVNGFNLILEFLNIRDNKLQITFCAYRARGSLYSEHKLFYNLYEDFFPKMGLDIEKIYDSYKTRTE